MDLVHDVSTALGVDAERATQGIGAVFVAIRMAVDAKTFSEVAAGLPSAGSLMQHAPFEGGRTGEMLALATPASVQRLLRLAGFTEAQIPKLCALVGAAVKGAVSADVWKTIAKRLPVF